MANDTAQPNDEENKVELSPRDIEAQAEQARVEDAQQAKDAKATKKAKKRSTPTQRNIIIKTQRDESYKRTMKRVQSELPVRTRMFSKIIHIKFIESLSDAIGFTIARPNSILAGSIMAFALTLITYSVSKTIGYKLSGFETIAAFIIGWLLGIVYDYFKVMFNGKKS